MSCCPKTSRLRFPLLVFGALVFVSCSRHEEPEKTVISIDPKKKAEEVSSKQGSLLIPGHSSGEQGGGSIPGPRQIGEFLDKNLQSVGPAAEEVSTPAAAGE